MRSALAETLHTAMQPVEKLRAPRSRGACRSRRATSMEYARQRGSHAGRLAQRDGGGGAQISGARTVYVLGLGMSSSLAMLTRHLQPFCQHVVEMAGPGGTEVAAGQLVHIRRGDVLVVFVPALFQRRDAAGAVRAQPARHRGGDHR
jgi:hypothetical protein